jgi:hypothetical protein
MSERKGADDGALLAVERLHALRQLPHSALREQASGDWRDEEIAGLSGHRYRRRTRILATPDGQLHIRIVVDDGTRIGALRPLAEEIVHVLPDGHFLREHTPAGAERRRFQFPTPWFPYAVGLLCVILIVLFLLNT